MKCYDKVRGIMCCLPSGANELQVTMTEVYRNWRNTDPFRRQDIWKHLTTRLGIEKYRYEPPQTYGVNPSAPVMITRYSSGVFFDDW